MGFRFRSAKLSHAEVKAATSRTNRTNPPEFQTPDFRPSLVASNAQSRKIKTGMTVEPPTIAAQNVGKLSRRIAAVNARNSYQSRVSATEEFRYKLDEYSPKGKVDEASDSTIALPHHVSAQGASHPCRYAGQMI
jgi:hypothetical protein